MKLDFGRALFLEKLVDTHVHFNELRKNFIDVHYLINECIKNGFSYFLDIGLHPSDFYERKQLLGAYTNILLTVGIHPLNEASKCDFELIEKILAKEVIVAVGEIGLDYFKADNKVEQIEALSIQLDLASKYNKPVILHVRDAYDDVYNVIKSSNFISRGILHCYSGTYEYAKKFIDFGFKISFAGNLTFKNSEPLRAVLKKLNIKDILIETDSPFLAPVPLRGKINAPLFLGYTCLEIAKIKNCDLRDVVIALYDNFKDLFEGLI
ncbi:TatD family hydrolase [Borrelia anserina]|uniref:DNase, TatD family n=2 Tax=Borrelia anserina TaxID=143 RepID=W5SNS8_BORAN|nr:TatD family hydrolase [Borrelia anserina]AHH08154.1 DNase, TatD family [Borrelia anserina BA2]AHH08839.1 DNase, TatD family [Borrelia anserina BA2]APR64688.1 hydrolase [Borrelia anserina Es]UPA06602.1 TatD family hydrolase [Borrelia anserina]